MKFWARNQGKGWGPVWICLGFMLAHADAFAANDAPAIAAKDEPPCLSLKEVHDGYPRYRVVEGRRCWYASTRGPEAKPAEVDVNPYDDPHLERAVRGHCFGGDPGKNLRRASAQARSEGKALVHETMHGQIAGVSAAADAPHRRRARSGAFASTSVPRRNVTTRPG